MKVSDAIRAAMNAKGMRFADLVEATGLASNTLANRLNGDRNLSLDKVDELLKAVGYKMVIVPVEEEIKVPWFEVNSQKYADDVDRISTTTPGPDL